MILQDIWLEKLDLPRRIGPFLCLLESEKLTRHAILLVCEEEIYHVAVFWYDGPESCNKRFSIGQSRAMAQINRILQLIKVLAQQLFSVRGIRFSRFSGRSRKIEYG